MIHPIIFESPAMVHAVEMAERVAPKNVPVLLSGETGTGKEVIARIIHNSSGRRGKLIAINCAALPRDLVEAELFGALKGAYTGAHRTRRGLVLCAQGGTLFLDELSELPTAMQAKLLRVLQDKLVRPVGAEDEIEVDFRLVVALNADPQELMRQRRLRPDLFYRINVVNVHLPPLRERMADILPLAKMFLRHYAVENNGDPLTLSTAVGEKLVACGWPGNVRQLQNEMQRLSVLHTGEVDVDQLAPEIALNDPVRINGNAGVDGTLESHEREIIRQRLIHCDDKQRVAETLGIGRSTLYKKILHYRLDEWNHPRKRALRLDLNGHTPVHETSG